MNSIHNNDGNDKALHDELDHLGRSYSELEQLEPPDLVNQAILNSAHRAVEKKPHWMKFGWLHGLTTTAVFVLAFSLILQQPESTPVYQQDPISNEAETTRAAKSTSEPTLVTPEVDAGAILELKPDMARRQAPVMASAPVISLEKEETPEATYLTESMQENAADMPAESAPELAAGMAQIQIDPEPDMEEKIERIIRLKIDGDQTWIAELAAFRKQYPDFPIPEELSEQK